MAKRIISLFCAAIMIASLCSCERREKDTHEVENLELIRTMTIDKTGGKITLTACTGTALEEQSGKIFTSEGSGVAEAMENLRRSYTKSEAYFAHTEHILIGKDAYDCLSEVLDLVSRSIDLRMGINIFFSRNSSGADIVEKCSGKDTSVSDMLTSVVREGARTCKGYVFTCLDVMSSLATDGCGLICAVDMAQNTEKSEASPEYGIQPNGFAVVKGDKILGFTDERQTQGAVMLTNDNSMQTISLGDVTVQVTDISVKYSSDDFSRVNVSVEAVAAIIEDGGRTMISDDNERRALEKKLALQLLDQIKSCLKYSCSLNTDFCAVGRQLEMKHPIAFDRDKWSDNFTDVQFDISVSAKLKRTYDVLNPIELKGEKRDG